MKTEEQMRAEFENWAEPRYRLEVIERIYANSSTRRAFDVWKACQRVNNAEIARLREALLEIAGMDVDFRATIIATKALNGENHE